MHERDYILRVIEQLGAALVELRRRILGRRDVVEVRGALAEVAGRAGLDVELLRGFDVDTLRMLVSPTGEVEPARCWLMAEVLYLDGLESAMSGGDGRASFVKARALYDLIRPAGGLLVGLPEAAERIAEIDAHLAADARQTPGPDPEGPRRRVRSGRRGRTGISAPA